MRQTNWRGIRDFGPNAGLLMSADTYCDVGNVVSPTTMIGLPFNSLIEMANQYPDTSQVEGLE